MSSQSPDRREFLKAGAAPAFTTSILTGRVRGANDRIAAGYIGLGKMGATPPSSWALGEF